MVLNDDPTGGEPHQNGRIQFHLQEIEFGVGSVETTEVNDEEPDREDLYTRPKFSPLAPCADSWFHRLPFVPR